ncbi:PREDICTED: uncharacterized protein LOC105459028 isoform X2 [Wasmannia auropunctata]|uniref:uncharacterized protein LOC105459028 isoform X2 n=1 Tax=Wasmannia auropunctata TaxID=64793 RepID=UPI0005EE9F21|nr:PREDICTED: uncharacterized protein LOC105459028 isoform X2 [Wasmannia auropunctata]
MNNNAALQSLSKDTFGFSNQGILVERITLATRRRVDATSRSNMALFPANSTKPLVGGNYVLNVLNYINELNESFSAEQLKCLERQHQERENQRQEQQECEVSWDTILCWPRTLSGTLATIPCFDELNGIPYDSTLSISRTIRELYIHIRNKLKKLLKSKEIFLTNKRYIVCNI